MRSALFVAAALASACKGDPARPDAADIIIDAYKPPWFYPAPGEVKNWDIQLGSYDFGTPRAMIVVNLWDVVPTATTITYDDASTVTVPAGSQATAIATLKAGGAQVMCHVGMGAVNIVTDPDREKFPGFEATPPDRPDPIDSGSSIGWSTPAGADERFVDFRNLTAASVLKKRIKLAKDIGCGGILAYRNDASAFAEDPGKTPGFDVTSFDETAWITDVAKTGHDLMISVGGRGGHAEPNVGEIDDDYDWLVAERCAEVGDCDAPRSFIEQNHAVFGIDYDLAIDGTTALDIALLCQRWRDGQVDGIQKKAALDGQFRVGCP
jgi:hypothetical protein